MSNLLQAIYAKVKKLALNIGEATAGQVLKAKGDGTAEFGDEAGGKKYATIVIGNTAAGHTEKDCDYLCDGVADDVEINAAISDLTERGGKILLLPGTYYLANKIHVQANGNIEICGENFGSVILESTQTFEYNGGFFYVSNQDNVLYKNLILNVKYFTQGSIIYFDPYGDPAYGCGVENIKIFKMYPEEESQYSSALQFNNSRDCFAKNVYTDFNKAVRMYRCINANIDSVTQRNELADNSLVSMDIGGSSPDYGYVTIQNCSTTPGGKIVNAGQHNKIINNNADVTGGYSDNDVVTGNRSGNITSVVSNSDLYDVIIGSTNAGHTLTDCDFLCDGETDSTTILSAIQHAINNYTSDRPKILFLTSEYILQAPIIIDFGGQIQFSGDKENPPIIARCWDAGESEDYMFSSLNCCLFFYGINLQTMLQDVPVPSIGNHCVKSPWVKFEYCSLRNFAGTVGEELGSGDSIDGTYINVLNSRIRECPLGIMADFIEKSEFHDTPVRFVYPEGQIVSDNTFSSSGNYDPYDVLTIICGSMTAVINNRFNCGAIEQPATVIVIDEFSQNCLVANNIAPYGVIVDNGTDDFIAGATTPTHVEYVTLTPENWNGGPPHQTVSIGSAFSSGAMLNFFFTNELDQKRANEAYLSFSQTTGTEITFGVSSTPTESISFYIIEVGNNEVFSGSIPMKSIIDYGVRNTSVNGGSFNVASASWVDNSYELNLGYYPIAESAVILFRATSNAEAWKTAGGTVVGTNAIRSRLMLSKTGALAVDVSLQILILPNTWMGDGIIMDWTP